MDIQEMLANRPPRQERHKHFYNSESRIPLHIRIIKSNIPRLTLYLTVLTCFAYTFFLSAHSLATARISTYQPGEVTPEYIQLAGMMMFGLTLFVILNIFSLINYQSKKRVMMLVIYLVMSAIVAFLAIFIFHLYDKRLNHLLSIYDQKEAAGEIVTSDDRFLISQFRVAWRSQLATVIFHFMSLVSLAVYSVYQVVMATDERRERKIIARGQVAYRKIAVLRKEQGDLRGRVKAQCLYIDDLFQHRRITRAVAQARKDRLNAQMARRLKKLQDRIDALDKVRITQEGRMVEQLRRFDFVLAARNLRFYERVNQARASKIESIRSRLGRMREEYEKLLSQKGGADAEVRRLRLSCDRLEKTLNSLTEEHEEGIKAQEAAATAAQSLSN